MNSKTFKIPLTPEYFLNWSRKLPSFENTFKLLMGGLVSFVTNSLDHLLWWSCLKKNTYIFSIKWNQKNKLFIINFTHMNIYEIIKIY